MTKYVKVSSMKMFIQVAEDKPNVEVKPTNPAKQTKKVVVRGFLFVGIRENQPDPNPSLQVVQMGGRVADSWGY